MIALLVVLSFAWFILGVFNAVLFSMMLNQYTDGEMAGTTTMFVAMALVLAVPFVCGHSVIHGWRSVNAGNPGRAVKVSLIPFPVFAAVYAYMTATGVW